MRTRSTLAFALLVGSIQAQPVLERSEMLPFGASVPYRIYNNFAAVDTSIHGPNVTWDFTGLMPQAGSSAFTLTVVDPASTPHGAMVSTDNYAQWEQPSNNYRMFEITPTFMQRVGSYTGLNYVYADPQVEYVFPLTYGTTNVDEWFGQADGGEYVINCIGYGTLLLPGATFDDVLMVRVDLSGSLYDIDVYFWYSSTNGSILTQYVNSWVASSGLYFDAEAASVQEHQDHRPTLLTNPVQDQLRFVLGEGTGAMDYTVRSSTGAMVSTGSFAAQPGMVQTVDAEGISPGIYFLQLTEHGTPTGTAVPFVKQ